MKKNVIHREQGNIKVSGEPAYIIDTCIGKTVTRRGKHTRQLCPRQLSVGIPVNAKKAEDVDKHFGDDWRKDVQLSYYKKHNYRKSWLLL